MDQFATGRSSLIIKLFSPAGAGSSLDIVRSGDSVVDLASFTAAQLQSNFIYNIGTNDGAVIPVEVNVSGRYMRFQKSTSSTDSYITLNEIQIFEADRPVRAVRTFSTAP